MPLSDAAQAHLVQMTFKKVVEKVTNEKGETKEVEKWVIRYMDQMTLTPDDQKFIYHAHQYLNLHQLDLSRAFQKWAGKFQRQLYNKEKLEAIVEMIIKLASVPAITPELRAQFSSVMDRDEEMIRTIQANIVPKGGE